MRIAALLVLVPVLAGCTGFSDGPADPYYEGEREARARSGGESNLLLHEEIQEFPEFTAFRVIQRFRPTWLRPRPVLTGPGQPMYVYPRVWLDHNHYEDVRILETVRAEAIEYIRYLDPSDATTRYGLGYVAGAIVIETRSH